MSTYHQIKRKATPPLKDGGLGVRSTALLATSDFLASATGTAALQEQIFISISITSAEDQSFSEALENWTQISRKQTHTNEMSYIQENWDNVVIVTIVDQLLSNCTEHIDKARILVALSSHAGY